jgi:hypothetical protein
MKTEGMTDMTMNPPSPGHAAESRITDEIGDAMKTSDAARASKAQKMS